MYDGKLTTEIKRDTGFFKSVKIAFETQLFVHGFSEITLLQPGIFIV